MRDLHAHILPGVDDGPGDWDVSLRMLDVAVRDGIKGIAATPHVSHPVYDNRREAVAALVAELKGRAAGLPIEIYIGSELKADPETLDGLKEGRYTTINSGRYALIELPGQFTPDAFYGVIFSMTSQGLVPVIAHPERNPRIQKEIEILHEMVRLGALAQLTAGSLAGEFGTGIKRLAGEMLSRRLAHILASDAHDDLKRPPVLTAGLKEAARLIGKRAAAAMVCDLPDLILKDEHFQPPEPVYLKKKFMSFFKARH